MLSKTTAVISLAMAVCTAGSSASGATVSTYASVSESWVLAQTDTTESGASVHVQPVPEIESAVNFDGSTSVTVTAVPLVGAVPALLTVIV